MLDLTSISAYKDYHFNAVNDDGTPFDVYRNAGGFWNDYKQWTQEFRVNGNIGESSNYQAGVYYMKVHNVADYRREWANDAGAWFASAAQYNRLDATRCRPLPAAEFARRSADVVQLARGRAGHPERESRGVRPGELENRRCRYADHGTALHEGRPADHLQHRHQGQRPRTGVQPGCGQQRVTWVDSLPTRQPACSIRPTRRPAGAGRPGGAALLRRRATATPGGAYNSLTAAQRVQVADAKAIRRAQIGVVFPTTAAEGFEETQPAWVVSPSWKLSEQVSTYVSWQHGEKAGISQFVNGISNLVEAEKTEAYEIGLKTVLLNDTLVFNTAVFYSEIEDYQQSVRIVDEYTTNLNLADGHSAGPGDGLHQRHRQRAARQGEGRRNRRRLCRHPRTRRFASRAPTTMPTTRNSRISRSRSRTDIRARRRIAMPAAKTLPGSFKYAFNVGVDYRAPFSETLEWHATANAAWQDKFNSDVALSSYAWIPDRAIVDFSIGWGTRSGSFDASLLLKNAFDDNTNVAQSWNSFSPAFPRWWGVVFSGKL